GEYTLIVSEAQNRFPPQERKFLINKYEKPRLNKELEWARKSYGPGEEGVANCKASPAGGGPAIANQPVTATGTIDGKTYAARRMAEDSARPALSPGAGAEVQVRFRLPAEIDSGSASLAVNFFDGGHDETLSKPIPLVLKKLNVEFYPEGGDLVAGVPN